MPCSMVPKCGSRERTGPVSLNVGASSHTPILKEPLVVYEMGIGVFAVVGLDCALGRRILPSYNPKLLPFLEFVVFCFCKML